MSKRKRQFKGTSKPPVFYDRKVQHHRTGRTLSISKVIPKEWAYVRIIPRLTEEKRVMIDIYLLMTVKELAQIKANNQKNKPDT